MDADATSSDRKSALAFSPEMLLTLGILRCRDCSKYVKLAWFLGRWQPPETRYIEHLSVCAVFGQPQLLCRLRALRLHDR